ncbi:hypothetical protein MIR68_008013 [Amoeboaphelidium protococcarum]|nr:hypothetical protein MIR68_008013 [Amoeboaphelidium protococcarum]
MSRWLRVSNHSALDVNSIVQYATSASNILLDSRQDHQKVQELILEPEINCPVVADVGSICCIFDMGSGQDAPFLENILTKLTANKTTRLNISLIYIDQELPSDAVRQQSSQNLSEQICISVAVSSLHSLSLALMNIVRDTFEFKSFIVNDSLYLCTDGELVDKRLKIEKVADKALLINYVSLKSKPMVAVNVSMSEGKNIPKDKVAFMALPGAPGQSNTFALTRSDTCCFVNQIVERDNNVTLKLPIVKYNHPALSSFARMVQCGSMTNMEDCDENCQQLVEATQYIPLSDNDTVLYQQFAPSDSSSPLPKICQTILQFVELKTFTQEQATQFMSLLNGLKYFYQNSDAALFPQTRSTTERSRLYIRLFDEIIFASQQAGSPLSGLISKLFSDVLNLGLRQYKGYLKPQLSGQVKKDKSNVVRDINSFLKGQDQQQSSLNRPQFAGRSQQFRDQDWHNPFPDDRKTWEITGADKKKRKLMNSAMLEFSPDY